MQHITLATHLCLHWQVNVPESTRTQRLTTAGTTAAALSVLAAAGSGTSSLLRSIGHTQFLAMCVSLAVPYLPSEFIKLCQGLQ
jgi:hypothetical protein